MTNGLQSAYARLHLVNGLSLTRCRLHVWTIESRRVMDQTIFYPGLNEFCRTYLVSNRAIAPAEMLQFPMRLKEENACIFEQLMLFDKISFKVYGENIVVPYLIGQLGQDAFETLLEQNAIGFTLWTPVVTYMVQDIPGVVGIQAGIHSSPAHS